MRMPDPALLVTKLPLTDDDVMASRYIPYAAAPEIRRPEVCTVFPVMLSPLALDT